MKKSLQEIIGEIKNKRKTLFILCGLPYSGKTYFANKIVEKTHIEYVSVDDVFHELGYDWTTNKLPDEKTWGEIFKKTYNKSREALEKSINVLYDSTNHTRSSRDILRKLASEVGAETHVIFIDVPTQVVYDRWEKNRLNQTRPVVDKILVDKVIRTFEKPTEDELILTLNYD